MFCQLPPVTPHLPPSSSHISEHELLHKAKCVRKGAGTRVTICDITGPRSTVSFEQLDVYPRTTGIQRGTQRHDKVKELAGKILHGYYKNSQPGMDKRSKDERGRKRPLQ
jgi:hypothetical protein